MDRLITRLVPKYNAWKHRTIGMRPIDVTLTIVDKLEHVYNSKDRIRAIQSGWLGMCEQIQDDLWERLHQIGPRRYLVKVQKY